jgi:hypothetical protein
VATFVSSVIAIVLVCGEKALQPLEVVLYPKLHLALSSLIL